MRRIIFIAFIFCYLSLNADDRFTVGVTGGYQYDVGALSGKNGIDAQPQQNVTGGILLKLDMSRLYLRSGAEYSYPVKKGTIGNGTAGDVTTTAINFIEWPLYGGISVPLRNFGSFYIGGGGSFIFGFGYLKTASGRVNISEQLFGYGILAGIEYEIEGRTSVVFEWEYLSARSSPVASTGAGTYDDYQIDYSGQRVRCGAVYHFSRY